MSISKVFLLDLIERLWLNKIGGTEILDNFLLQKEQTNTEIRIQQIWYQQTSSNEQKKMQNVQFNLRKTGLKTERECVWRVHTRENNFL